MTIIINPYEGYPIINGYSAAHEGQDFGTHRIMDYVAASDGVVVQTGGEFNQIIVRMDDGRYWRTAENAQILVSVGQRISIFQVIARNAFYRGGLYRSPHINGGGDNNRSVFTSMVTMTQAQAHAALAPPAPPAPNVRHTVAVGANVRSAPSLVAPKGTPLKGNIDVAMSGFAHGDNTSGTDIWFQHAAGWSHASGFTDQGDHDLADETPTVVVPPIVITPPVVEVPPPVVVPPIVPPVVEPPVVVVDTPPVADVPPVVNVPPVVAPPTAPPVVVITPPPLVSKLTPPKAAGITLIAGVLAAIVAGVLHFIGLF